MPVPSPARRGRPDPGALVVVAALAAGCPIRGDGELAEETRTIAAAIDRLEVLDGFDVDVTLDPDREPGAEVVVRGDRNLLGTFYAEVHSQSALTLALQPTQESRPAAPLSASVTTRALTGLYVGEGSGLQVATLAGPGLALRARNDARVDLALADDAELAVDGREQAAITLEGAAASLDLALADAARVDAGDLVAARVHVDLRGDGDVIVCPTEALTGTITGATTLVVACEPALVDLQIDGEGSVRPDGP